MENEFRGMFKDMNNQMIEQKIVVAKINKLCLGALTSIEHLAKKVKEDRRSSYMSGKLFLNYNNICSWSQKQFSLACQTQGRLF